MVNNELQQLALWHTGFDKEMAFLTRAIQSATDQLAELVEQRDKEKEGAAADFGRVTASIHFQQTGRCHVEQSSRRSASDVIVINTSVTDRGTNCPNHS